MADEKADDGRTIPPDTDVTSALAQMRRQGSDPYLVHVFNGGPWHRRTTQQPRLFGVGEHCVPHGDDAPSGTWGSPDHWPDDRWRYRPVSAPGVEPVEMVWSLPRLDEMRGERVFALAGSPASLTVTSQPGGVKVIVKDVSGFDVEMELDARTAIDFGRAVIDRAAHDHDPSPAPDEG